MRRWLLVGMLAWLPLQAGGRVERRPPALAVPPLDGPRVAACLARAGELLVEERAQLQALAAGALEPSRAPTGPFAAFEGSWSGRWGAMEVRHRWYTVREGVQLVVVEDDGAMHEGINLALGEVLCGLVREHDGSFRAHEGRRVLGVPDALIWRTPQRAYVEWVDGERYHIQEWVLDGPRALPGVRATYQRR